jgi:hypothetical protein
LDEALLMIKGEFQAVLADEHGTVRWRRMDRETEFPAAQPLNGAGVAADLLERLPGYDGTLAAEYEAAGAMLHVRGESGYFENHRREPLWIPVYRRVIRLLDDAHDVETVHSPAFGPAREVRGLGAHMALSIDKAVEAAKARQIQTVALQNGEVPEALLQTYDRDFDLMRRYIRSGYRKAQRRYYPQGLERVRDMFERIERRVADVSRRASERESLYVFVAIPTGRLIIHHHNSLGRDVLRD